MINYLVDDKERNIPFKKTNNIINDVFSREGGTLDL